MALINVWVLEQGGWVKQEQANLVNVSYCRVTLAECKLVKVSVCDTQTAVVMRPFVKKYESDLPNRCSYGRINFIPLEK